MKRWLLSLGILVTVAGCGTLIAAEVVAERRGGSIDPTDPSNFDFFSLTNDTQEPLYVRLCADQKCRRLQHELDWEPIPPGRSIKEQVAWGDASPQMYAVATSPRADLPWPSLPLDAHRKLSTTVLVPLSSSSPCRC